MIVKKKKDIIIAIDGFSSCGKSTLAKQVAKELSYIYVDSGAMYRAVTLYALNNGFVGTDKIDEEGLNEAIPHIKITFKINAKSENSTWLNNQCVEDEIRGLKVSENVSAISALGFVREALVEQQRLMGEDKGIVMDGRDIGTVVFPDAELKVFVTASPEIRAERRFLELKEKGQEVPFEKILENIIYRDEFDQNREISPLRKAEDALDLDNSHLTREEQRNWVLDRVGEILSNI